MTVVSCSWCHAAVALVPGVRGFCLQCGHRADVPRGACDCPKCWKPDDYLVGLTPTGPITLSGVWDDGPADPLATHLADLVEAALRAGDPVDDFAPLVDALIAIRGLGIAE